ncbi:hypothetical protein DE146DRAFT_100755, partial [Phaeosphaeria sp. MPI-PUGE-AT-0046c]
SANVWAVQIRLIVDPTDSFTSFTGSTTSSIASASSFASPGASSSVTTPTSAPLKPDLEKTLSGGAIAAIVIGVLALFVLLAGAVFFFLRRSRQQANNNMSISGPHNGGDLPEFVAPYANSTAHQSATKIPPVITEKIHSPSLRTAVSPGPATPTQTDTAELFFSHPPQRTSDISELASPTQNHHQSMRDTYSTTTSATYPRSPLSELASFESPHDSQVARLEAEKLALEERIARMRQLAQMEEEQARMRVELEGLRGSGAR